MYQGDNDYPFKKRKEKGDWEWMGLRIMLRDHTGRIIATEAKQRRGHRILAQPRLLELTLRYVFAGRWVYKTLIRKGDAQIVTKAICSNEVNMSIFGHVAADAQNRLQSFKR